MRALGEMADPSSQFDPAHEHEAYCPACESHPCDCAAPLF
jgi:hypothetical protein